MWKAGKAGTCGGLAVCRNSLALVNVAGFARRMKWRIFFLGLGLAAGLGAAEPVPQFNATLSVGKDHRFVLVDGSGKASSFLALGESFAGYALKRYDPKSGVLEIEREGREYRLTLVSDAAVKDAPPPPMPATIADAEAALNKMHLDEMMERSLAQQKKAVAAQFQQLTTRMVAQGVDPTEAAEFRKKLTDEVFSVLDPKQLKGDVTRIYSEVFTKQELEQMGAFFTTPLGEMISARQPVVQEKLGAIVQARMAEVMPRVQQMGVDFAMTQKAKRDAAGGAAPAPAPAPKK